MADPELIIDAEPDWNSGIEISYGFQTVVSTTPRFVEQRRPLYPSVTRALSCSFVLEGESAQSLVNKLIYGKALLLCVPIYSEPIFATAITAGLSSITTTEDISYFWNIQNCVYAVAINFVTGASQMLLVTAAAGTLIALTEAIGETFDASQSVIYPAFAGILKSFKKANITDIVSVIDCEFEEASLQSEEYDGSAVALADPQICPDDLWVGGSPSISPSASASPSPSSWTTMNFTTFTEESDACDELTVVGASTASITGSTSCAGNTRLSKVQTLGRDITFRFKVYVAAIGSMASSSRTLRLLRLYWETGDVYACSLFFENGYPLYKFYLGYNQASGQEYSNVPLTRYIEIIKAGTGITINIYTDSDFTGLEWTQFLSSATYDADVIKVAVLDNYSAYLLSYTVRVESLEYQVND